MSLRDAYRAFARHHFGGTSIAFIADEDHVSRQAIQQRLASIVERLPMNWDLVFGTTAKGNDIRQQLYPLPQVGLGQRSAAERMARLGVAGDVIEQVTGNENEFDANALERSAKRRASDDIR